MNLVFLHNAAILSLCAELQCSWVINILNMTADKTACLLILTHLSYIQLSCLLPPTLKKKLQNKVCSGNAEYQLFILRWAYCSILPAPFTCFLQCQKVLKYWMFKPLITFSFTQYDKPLYLSRCSSLIVHISYAVFKTTYDHKANHFKQLNGDCSQHKPGTRLSPQLNKSSWNSRDVKGLSANIMFSVC